MTVFESLNRTTDKAVDSAEKYLESSRDYLKLKVFQQLTVSLSLVSKFAIIGGIAVLGLMFLALAGALAIGEALNNVPLGFVVIGTIFLIIAIIIYGLRSRIEKKIIKTLSPKFFDN